MTEFEKFVKVFAVTLAIIIIATIATTLLGVLSFTGEIIDGFSYHGSHLRHEYYPERYDGDNYDEGDYSHGDIIDEKRIQRLEIDLDYTSLEIRDGEEFKIEKYDTDDRVYFTNTKGTLKIKETEHHFWHHNGYGQIVVCIPKDNTLTDIEVNKGAGKAVFSGISAEKFDFEQGAGSLLIEDCTFDNTEIEGGAGKMVIRNSTLRNLDMESNVGSVDIEAYVLGSSKIESGVGSLRLKLKGNREDYSIVAKKGIGSLYVDGEKNLSNYGSGPNYVNVEGGTGSVRVDFENKRD